MLKQLVRPWIGFKNRRVECARPLRGFMAFLIVIIVVGLSWQPAAAYPPPGTDEFDSSATITIDLSMSGGPTLPATVVGRTRIERGNPYDPGDGQVVIDVEIVSMELSGITPMGPISVRESEYRDSSGEVKQKSAGVDFPADSYFNIYVEIETPMGVLLNIDPIRLQAEIDALPPLQAEYTPPAIIGVALYTRTGKKVGVITHASHFVGQKPSFSVAPAGPSNLDAAQIFDVSTALRISPAGLGLTTADDLDALSYGIDYINYNSSIHFSVDPNAVGVAGSAVAIEAGKNPKEAHGDEFRVSPAFPMGGSNVQVLDETGDTASPFPLLISDDVDAITEPPASFVDYDSNGVPDAWVYFSLAAGSPTLGTISASPADILRSIYGIAPTVFITETALGLVPGDDVDAFCLEPFTGKVLFSLAPGSPTLGLVPGGAGPADLFGGAVPPPFTSPLSVYAPASLLGLLETDNLNALKCTLPEVDHFPFSLAEMTIEAGTYTETIQLSGPATVYVAIGPDGATQEQTEPEQVAIEMVQMELTGNSSLIGPVIIRTMDATVDPVFGSYGSIQETTNNTSGVLDLPPFAANGTADSYINVYFTVEMGGQTFYTLYPKRMEAVITHKPPAKRETYENFDRTQLYDTNWKPTGIFITAARHTPNPPITVHDSSTSQAQLVLNNGVTTETITVIGRTTSLIFTGPEGLARDPDGDGLDQIHTELPALTLTGQSSNWGPVDVRVRDQSQSPFQRSTGEIEEKNNHTTGVLDVSPIHPGGLADSFFDLIFEIEFVNGGVYGAEAITPTVYHNESPLRLQAVISQTSPAEGVTYQNQITVTLVDENGSSTGWSIDAFTFTPLLTVPPSAINISGPVTGTVGTNHGFEATVTPISTTLPLTYTWEATEQTPVTHTVGSLTDTVTFNWNVAGAKTITATTMNIGGSVSNTHVITISGVSQQVYLYLPLIERGNTQDQVVEPASADMVGGGLITGAVAGTTSPVIPYFGSTLLVMIAVVAVGKWYRLRLQSP